MNKNLSRGLLALALGLPLIVLGPASERAARAASSDGPRQVANIDKDWEFALIDNGRTGPLQNVDIPHSWNIEDTIDGDYKYRMGPAIYRKTLTLSPRNDRRYFLRFEGANEKAWVSVNGTEAGSHRGGYTAFAFEITDLLKDGENLVEVKVDNSQDRDIMPLYCDFNFYGGIYRSVHLITTAKDCIAVTDYASPGVYLSQKEVTPESADLEFKARVSADSGRGLKVRFRVLDRDGRELKKLEAAPEQNGDWLEATAGFTMNNPHLWNGLADPYMYRVRTELLSGGKVVDAIDQPLGLRFYRVDGEKGFFLNGRKYRIQGVCRHQDREGKANAISAEDHEQDFAIMREMGVNSVRLAHYPQADYAYSICDREGILVWAELPFIGAVGDHTGIFLKSEAFRDNLKQQLTELVRQNYNHPAILFWGLFNEIRGPGDPTDMVAELNDLAHREDPYRLTTVATNHEGSIDDQTDLICWNRYHGWYYGKPEDFGAFFDKQHEKHPDRLLCVSEYGAGASIKQHSEIDYKVPTTGPWHPENWQALVHEKHWAMITEREYLWGSFLWNMFDFCVVTRHEGDRANINDKGMVTYDRKQRKDAFYFYQANWTDQPMIHINDKRFTKRRLPVIDVKVYSNAGPVELEVNGEKIEMTDRGYHVFTAEKVRLKRGSNKVVATATTADGRVVTDECEWEL